MSSAAAQQQRQFAETQQANQAALRQYSWKSRTELKVGGESKQVRLEQVRYDIDVHMPPDRVQAFAARASMARGQGLESGAIRIEGRDVLAIGDRMTLWVDPVSSMMRRVEISARYDNDPVSIVADYRSLENGLTYQARSTLRYPNKQVEVVVETFDYLLSSSTR
jgi:hypothetical protein